MLTGVTTYRYDNYLNVNNGGAAGIPPPNTRNSGIGNMLLNMEDDSDDDDDSDDEDERRQRPAKPPGLVTQNSSLKPAVNAAAVSAPPAINVSLSNTAAANPEPLPQSQPSPQLQPKTPTLLKSSQQGPPSPPRQPIAAPRPGYPAPIATLNGQANNTQGGMSASFAAENPFEPTQQPQPRAAPTTSVSPSPHPLHPPMTPITPAFIRPTPSPSPTSIKFSEKPPRARQIMRGNTEETLLPSRGEKGDDFWRRFSIVAKEPLSAHESSWLRKTRDGSTHFSRWVWIVGFVIVVLILGGIGFGVWATRNSPGHQQPTPIGGSGDHLATGTTTSTTVAAKTGTGLLPSVSVKHVSPTNTIDKRDSDGLEVPTPAPQPTIVLRHAMKMRRGG